MQASKTSRSSRDPPVAEIEGFWAFGEEASVPVARGLCSFYASQQLKVLHLIVSKARAKVNIQRFHSVLFVLQHHAEG